MFNSVAANISSPLGGMSWSEACDVEEALEAAVTPAERAEAKAAQFHSAVNKRGKACKPTRVHADPLTARVTNPFGELSGSDNDDEGSPLATAKAGTAPAGEDTEASVVENEAETIAPSVKKEGLLKTATAVATVNATRAARVPPKSWLDGWEDDVTYRSRTQDVRASAAATKVVPKSWLDKFEDDDNTNTSRYKAVRPSASIAATSAPAAPKKEEKAAVIETPATRFAQSDLFAKIASLKKRLAKGGERNAEQIAKLSTVIKTLLNTASATDKMEAARLITEITKTPTVVAFLALRTYSNTILGNRVSMGKVVLPSMIKQKSHGRTKVY